MTTPFRYAIRHKRLKKTVDLEQLMCYNSFRAYHSDSGIQSKVPTYLITNKHVLGLL